MRAIHAAVKSGRSKVRAVACEKPLGRTLAEAREVLALAEDAGLAHGYLENQVFSTAVERGKEIIWRRAVPAPVGPTSPAPPRNTPARTSRGSGRANARAAG